MKPCLSLFLLLSLTAVAQKKPSAADMNKAKQMQAQMQNQIEKELQELEKDNPEMAKQARQMLNQRTQKSIYATTATKTQKFISLVETIPYKGVIVAPTTAQAKDKLLWYKGKKLNDSMLVTTSGALVLYSKNRSKVVVRPNAKQDPFGKVMAQLARGEEAKKEFINGMVSRKNAAFFYPGIAAAVKEIDRLQNQYVQLLKNTIDIPSFSAFNTSYKFQKKGSLAAATSFIVSDIPGEIEKMHQQLLADMAHPEPLDFPPPPTQSKSICFSCDSNAQKKYDRQLEEWNKKFNEFEANLVRKSLAISKALMNIGDEAAAAINSDIMKAQAFALKRTDQKIALLQQQYGKDFSRMQAVVQQTISAERQKQLLGINEQSGTDLLSAMQFDAFERFLEDQMNQKNYSVIFNFPFIIGMERQKQLLGAGEDASLQYFDKLMAFNRFALTMDIGFESVMSDDDGPVMTATGIIATPKKVFVSLGLQDCKYQLFLTDTKYGEAEETDYRIPLVVQEGIKKVKEKKEWHNYYYTGPKEMLAVFPPFKIDFCDDKSRDSVYLQILRYKADDLSPYAKAVENSYGIDLLGFVSQMFFMPKQLEGATGDISQLATQFMQTGWSSGQEQSTGNTALDKLRNDYNRNVKTIQYQDNLSKIGMVPQTLMLFDAQNNASVLVDAEVNTAHKLSEKVELTKGVIHLKIVHDPDQYESIPFRKPLIRK